MLTLITNGDIYAPEPRGRGDILLVDGKIGKVGAVDRDAAERLGVGLEELDVGGCYVLPGLIDPHQHLLGGSGESGFATQTPEISFSEIVSAGITTVVGCLGVDTTMKTMAGLLAKVKGLNEERLTAYLWSGGYSVPPDSILETVRADVMFISEAIGAGEIAISDRRAEEPEAHALAQVVTDAAVGGMLAKKAGVTHFHVGDGKRRMRCLFELLDETRFNIDPCCLYPTHVERSEALLNEAISLTKRGCSVDIDVVEQDLHEHLRFYLEQGGDLTKLTASSDAAISSPHTLYDQLRRCVREHGFTLEQLVPLFTSNVADVLRLRHKGRLGPGLHGDLIVLDRDSLALRHVLLRGEIVVRDGLLRRSERFLEDSNRRISLHGHKG